jgi:hypothetical protein
MVYPILANLSRSYYHDTDLEIFRFPMENQVLDFGGDIVLLTSLRAVAPSQGGVSCN